MINTGLNFHFYQKVIDRVHNFSMSFSPFSIDIQLNYVIISV